MKSSYLPQSFVTLVPSVWHPALQTLGLESENALACLQVDLDGQLRFAQELLIVTERRLVALQRASHGLITHQFWELRAGLSLRHSDHAGVACPFAPGACCACGALPIRIAISCSWAWD